MLVSAAAQQMNQPCVYTFLPVESASGVGGYELLSQLYDPQHAPQGANRDMFVHSFAAYCTVAGMGEKEEFLIMCRGGRHTEGQERASLGFQGTQSPRHRPAAPEGSTCSWR